MKGMVRKTEDSRKREEDGEEEKRGWRNEGTARDEDGRENEEE